ncbi:chemotaxis protein CheW [Bacillaceae bacterium W0354]
MEDLSKVIVFQLNDQQYGVNIQQVKSIEKLEGITQVPQSSKFVKGVINLRGEITPIIDLKERLNLGKSEYTNDTRVLIIQVEEVQVGLIVDSATDVIDLDESVVEPTPDMVGSIDIDLFNGVAKLDKMLLILLNVNRLLSVDEISEVDQLVATE